MRRAGKKVRLSVVVDSLIILKRIALLGENSCKGNTVHAQKTSVKSSK